MRKKKDNLDEVDLFINSGRMTREDEAVISEYIRGQKAKTKSVKTKRKRAV